MPVPFSTVNALVLREVKYKEADRILTLLTAERGIITAKARGALRKTSKTSAATQQLTYSEMTVFENNGRITVNEATVKEPFEGLRKDFEAFSLGCYFAEAAETLARSDIPEPDILRLMLNSLYALSCGMYSHSHIKAAFELRLASILGYAPDLSKCAVCGKPDPDNPTIGISTGHLCCRECRNSDIGITDYLTPESLSAMRYIISAPPKQFLAFSLEEGSVPYLCRACEDYLADYSSRRFQTLDYYKSIRTSSLSDS
ncbi:MAG: DNA repair protein RecO [Eubacteriales bacterium]|nr:DNA repair protein RecO [Eubacteriales bacterium]